MIMTLAVLRRARVIIINCRFHVFVCQSESVERAHGVRSLPGAQR